MKFFKLKNILAILMISLFCFSSCQDKKAKDNSSATQSTSANSSNGISKEDYYKMKSEIGDEDHSQYDNGEGNDNYDPNAAIANTPLVEKGSSYTSADGVITIEFDMRADSVLNGQPHADKVTIGKESFTRDLHNVTELDVQNFEHNMEYLKEVKSSTGEDGNCSGKNCPVYAHVNKEKQRLYLYINGEILDTFKTSTARSGYQTPNFDKKPDGRIYDKYSSHKYHGGNWNGMGNMPYAVFVSGGYAIHGATSGEIKQLGNPASHGCIRLHPENAKLFNRIVRLAGVENTWVHID